MRSERLPEYVEETLEVLRGFTIGGLEHGDDLGYEAAVAHANGVVASARLAIHRYAAEVRNAALEEAAKVCEEQRQNILKNPNDPSWTEHLAMAQINIRSLKTKEQADG